MTGPFIVVSGLPAAGKTAIGRIVATALTLPFLDKDDFLEREFDSHAVVDPRLRRELSRKSDHAFADRALELGTAVLVSFWRPTGQNVVFGTSTRWLTSLSVPVIELHCHCDAEIAQARFMTRQRHAGHNDASRTSFETAQLFRNAQSGPLGLWPTIRIDTSDLTDVSNLALSAASKIESEIGQ